MGLAASQARLLTITSRLSNTELRQQQIANTKMRLTADQEQVSTKYSNALNNQTLTLNDAPMTYSDLVAAGYSVVRTSDGVSAGASVSNQSNYNPDVKGYYRMPKNAREFAVLAEKLGFGKTYSPNGASDINSTNEGGLTFAFTKKLENGQLKDYPNGYSHGGIKSHFEEFMNDVVFQEEIIADAVSRGYLKDDSLQNVYKENTAPLQSTTNNKSFEEMLNNSDFLIQGILSGYLTLMKDGQQVSLAGSKEISTVYDKSDDAQAEAEYNAAMAKINRKEKALDSEMKRLDTEHSALQTELESIKSIISDHAGKDFNLFS